MIKNISNLGDAALYCNFGEEVNKETNSNVIKYFKNLKEKQIEGIINLTPSYNKLIISFDLRKTNFKLIKSLVLVGGSHELPVNPALIDYADGGDMKSVELMMKWGYEGVKKFIGGNPVQKIINSPRQVQEGLAVDLRACNEYKNGLNVEEVVNKAKTTGEPPLMLAMSVFFAIKDAIASISNYNTIPDLSAPATAEKILLSIKKLKNKV